MIRAALPSDLNAIEEIYDALFRADERRGKSFTNWQRGLYPTRDTARKAGKAGTLYVYEMGGDIAGAVNLNQIQPDEYAQIPWTIPAKESEVLVIHTLTLTLTIWRAARPSTLRACWTRRWSATKRSFKPRRVRVCAFLGIHEKSIFLCFDDKSVLQIVQYALVHSAPRIRCLVRFKISLMG